MITIQVTRSSHDNKSSHTALTQLKDRSHDPLDHIHVHVDYTHTIHNTLPPPLPFFLLADSFTAASYRYNNMNTQHTNCTSIHYTLSATCINYNEKIVPDCFKMAHLHILYELQCNHYPGSTLLQHKSIAYTPISSMIKNLIFEHCQALLMHFFLLRDITGLFLGSFGMAFDVV